MPCAGSLRLRQPLRALQCPEGLEQPKLCEALVAVYDLPPALHKRNEPRLEKALTRSTMGSCAGWLLLLLSKRHACPAEVLDLVPLAVYECRSSFLAREEPESVLGVLMFYTHVATASNASSATVRNGSANLMSACLANSFTSHSLPALGPRPPAFRPYSAVDNQPIELHCPGVAVPQPPLGIPDIVHFVYGLRENAPFGFVHLAAIRSAIAVHNPRVVMFHHAHQPSGPFWDAALATGRLSLIRVDAASIGASSGRCMRHVAHRADVLRLEVLLRYGGLYLDMDTLSLRPLPLELRREAEFIIGKQNPKLQTASDRMRVVSAVGELGRRSYYGLCNAVMAAVPGSRFVRHWLRLYTAFRSRGRDVLWDEHSVLLPARLVESCPALHTAVAVLEPHRFFPFYWDDARQVLLRRVGRRAQQSKLLQGTYVMHLWARGGRYGAEELAPPLLADACSASMRTTVYGQAACTFFSRLREEK